MEKSGELITAHLLKGEFYVLEFGKAWTGNEKLFSVPKH